MIAEGLLSRIYLACLRYPRKGSFLCSVTKSITQTPKAYERLWQWSVRGNIYVAAFGGSWWL